jgi:hypothetical protein
MEISLLALVGKRIGIQEDGNNRAMVNPGPRLSHIHLPIAYMQDKHLEGR